MKRLLLAAALAGRFLAPPPPGRAAAQHGGRSRVNELIVYGNDPCPRGKGNDIVVCARRPESDRYRIPSNLRDDPNDPANQAWARTAPEPRICRPHRHRQLLDRRPRRLDRLPRPADQAGARRARPETTSTWTALIDQARQERNAPHRRRMPPPGTRSRRAASPLAK